jgi:hypothetical protein
MNKNTGIFIIDDEITETTDNPTQEQFAIQWEWSSEQIFAQRWAKDDLCGKMLNGEKV